MNFPAGTRPTQKRDRLPAGGLPLPLPDRRRWRWATRQPDNAIFGCHELEVYPDDQLTCGSGNALIELDMSGAFDDMGTPNDFTDDKPRGTPLPCRSRASSSSAPFATGAMVTDCVDGAADGEPTDLDGARVARRPARRRSRASSGSAASTTRAAAPAAASTRRRSTRPRTSTSTTRPS